MNNTLDKQQEAYRIEAAEILAELENSLLELEMQPRNTDLIDRVFRAMHTIKGSGAMFGFNDIAAFTHDVENVYDQVRNGKMEVTTELVNLSLQARDHIKTMLDGGADAQRGRALLNAFQAISVADRVSGGAPPPAREEQAVAPSAPAAPCTYRIRFKPNRDLFHNGTNPLLLLNELRELGSGDVVVRTDRLPDPAQYDPEACYLYWDIVLTTAAGIDAVRDVFIFVEDQCDLSVETIDEAAADGEDDSDYKRLGEILVEKGDLSSDQLAQALHEQRRLGEVLVENHGVDAEKISAALAEQAHVKTKRQQNQNAVGASLRVDAARLDLLVDLVGELVTTQARLSQKAARSADPELTAIAEVVERLTAEMRDNTLSIRMLPIGATFNKLRRLVRDLSNELGKEVTMVAEGGETELDKTVIEQLNDPLVHIIRNCIDHGIESPSARAAAGKPAQGTVLIRASHSGANVVIRISDDGAGLDAAAIRDKAVEKGLLSADAEKSERELFNLIFAPGFSTARNITNVSGRGVGMDVVKRSIENLRGTIELESRRGEGMTIILTLPLTLAIIDGLLVGIEEAKYILPLSAIEECVELTRAEIDRFHGRNMLNIRNQIVPYIHLRDHFMIPGARPAFEKVVVNQVNGQRVGIVVDRVIGEHQIVIKTMSRLYEDIKEISGATILGDGTVALILDVQKLMHVVERSSHLN